MNMKGNLRKKNVIAAIRNHLRGKRGGSILDAGNQILIIMFVLLLGRVAGKYFSPEQVISNSALELASADHEIPMVDIEILKVKTFKTYEKGIKTRDLFKPLKNDLKVDPRVLQKALPALHKRIKLIGILVDGDSKAIIEDLKEKQIHFLSKGENLGLVVLEDIQEDKAIFKYDNERVEMAL